MAKKKRQQSREWVKIAQAVMKPEMSWAWIVPKT